MIIFSGIPILYFSSCVAISKIKMRSFEEVKIGDSESAVIDKLGTPGFRSADERAYTRYESSGCNDPCKERLWYENKLSLDIEAWSVDLDNDKRVIHKAHFTSP